MPDIYVSVKIEGEDATGLLQRVEVEASDLRAGLATLTFVDRWLVLPDVLHEGLKIEVDLGRQAAHALVFRGTVTSVRCRFPHGSPARVVLEAIDPLVKLSLQPKTKRWWNTTLSSIVREIALANGLQPGRISAGEDPTFDDTRPVRQVDETDLALLNRLAGAYDCKLFVDHSGPADQLCFVSTRDLLADSPLEEALVFNQNVADLEAGFEAFATDPERYLVTTDPLTGERVTATETLVTAADTAWTPDPQRIAGLGEGAAWVAQLVAKSAAVRAQLVDQWRTQHRMAGVASRVSSDHSGALGDRARRMGQSLRGRAIGTVGLQARKRVRLQGFGGRWSGDWYLALVRHELDVGAGTYLTAFTARR